MMTVIFSAFVTIRTRVFAVLACALAAGGAAAAATPCDDDGKYGSLLNAAEFDASVQALPPAAFLDPPVQPPLPVKVRLANLPAVAQQGTAASPGSPGSCEAQSFGYGLGSYTAARNPNGSLKWDPSTPWNSISAAYLYERALVEQKGACPAGSLSLFYPAQLVANGAPSREQVPYQPYCSYLNGAPRNYYNLLNSILMPQRLAMQKFRIGSYAAFHIDSDPALAVAKIKQYVAAGQAVAFSGSVLCNYSKAPPLQNGVIYETAIIPNSGHGQLVVGYDETVGTPGKTGALLIQNSMGVGWPPASAGPSAAPAGMAYWSYNSFGQTQKLAAVAYPAWTASPGGAPLRASGSLAPAATIPRAFQWAPGAGQGVFLILAHYFAAPVLLDSVALTEPGGAVVATAAYGQYISAGYSYLKRTDANASFLAGAYRLTLKGRNLSGAAIAYTGAVEVGAPRPTAPPGKSMTGQAITGSTGAAAQLGP